ILGDADHRDDYPDEAYALLAAVERKHFWFKQRNRLILSTLREAIGQLAGRSALDVGCGTGFVTAAIEGSGMMTCGIDMHLGGLRYARPRVRGPLMCTGATAMPFVSTFDVALLCDVIEHAADDVAVLRD